jgi:hypothetical protein
MKSITYSQKPSKTPANSRVKPQTPQNPHRKTHNQPKMRHLPAENKTRQNWNLVSLRSVQLKVDRK